MPSGVPISMLTEARTESKGKFSLINFAIKGDNVNLLGFTILDERYSVADGKRYVCICAEFTGTPCEISESFAYFGPDVPHIEDKEAYLSYLRAKREGVCRVAAAKLDAGINDGTADIVSLFDKRIADYM